jgi:hypothetical protein
LEIKSALAAHDKSVQIDIDLLAQRVHDSVFQDISLLTEQVQVRLNAAEATFDVNARELRLLNLGLAETRQASYESRELLLGTHRSMVNDHARVQIRTLHEAEAADRKSVV